MAIDLSHYYTLIKEAPLYRVRGRVTELIPPFEEIVDRYATRSGLPPVVS